MGFPFDKIYVQDAHWILPVHTDDPQLIAGYEMAVSVYTVSSLVTFLRHYLDAFHTLGAPSSSVNKIWTGLLTAFPSLAFPSNQTS